MRSLPHPSSLEQHLNFKQGPIHDESMAHSVFSAQDELGRITIKTAGCYTAFGAPVQCVTEGVFDLKWESQLQVRRPGTLTPSCKLLCTAHSTFQKHVYLCLDVHCPLAAELALHLHGGYF